MTDGRHGQPAGDETPHAIPKEAAILATPRQRAIPEASYLESKEKQRRLVHGYSVVAELSTHHCLQPLTQFRDGSVHAALKFGFHRVQLRLQPFADHLPQHRVHSVASLLHADMRKAKKVECFRFPFSTSLPVLDRERSKFQKSRFLGMQFQVELPQTFGKFRPKLIGEVLAYVLGVSDRAGLCNASRYRCTRWGLPPAPKKPSLRSGFYCPSPSTLNRPHPSHSQAHPVFAAWRFIRDAFAVLVRLGDPRVVPCFRCSFLLDMPPSTTAGSSLAACAQFLRQRCWPSPEIERLGTPKVPHHPLPMGRIFAASLVRYSLRPVKLLAPLADPTGYFAQPSEAFTPGLSSSRSPFSPPGITTVATEQAPPTGLSPAGTLASIAAPTSHSYDFCIHYTSPV
jgi:hypothetical protein